MELVINKVYKYSVVWRDKKEQLKEFRTDCLDTAFKKKVLKGGEMYEQTKYNALKRLQKYYIYLFNKGRLSADNISYNLVTIKK